MVDDAAADDADYQLVLSRLRNLLGDAHGKIRVSDVQRLVDKRRSYYRGRLIARAMRQLGWERGRYRFDGVPLYAYARGTHLQREVVLEVGRDDLGFVVRRKDA